jgi:hypothetical protein
VLKVDKIISWSFTCPVCGANCSTTIPVINMPVNEAMPPCPIPAGAVEKAIYGALPATSPLGGIKVPSRTAL